MDSWIRTLDSSNFLVINCPGDVVWCPFHLIDVPLVLGVEASVVVVTLPLAVAITVDDVHR